MGAAACVVPVPVFLLRSNFNEAAEGRDPSPEKLYVLLPCPSRSWAIFIFLVYLVGKELLMSFYLIPVPDLNPGTPVLIPAAVSRL